ncbi:hypothetical protein V8C86DRAFT_2912285 [Haematococcus lacustris]
MASTAQPAPSGISVGGKDDELLNGAHSLRPWQRDNGQRAPVLAAGVDVHAFSNFWHESLLLTPLDPQPPPPPAPPTPPSSSTSSSFGDELSEEEEEQLGRLLQVMPNLLSPGGAATAATSACLPAAPWAPVVSHPTQGWGQGQGHGGPEANMSLKRLARLRQLISSPVKEGTMISAMFEAARIGAEALDPYGPLRPTSAPPTAAPGPGTTSNTGSAALTSPPPHPTTPPSSHPASVPLGPGEVQPLGPPPLGPSPPAYTRLSSLVQSLLPWNKQAAEVAAARRRQEERWRAAAALGMMGPPATRGQPRSSGRDRLARPAAGQRSKGSARVRRGADDCLAGTVATFRTGL